MFGLDLSKMVELPAVQNMVAGIRQEIAGYREAAQITAENTAAIVARLEAIDAELTDAAAKAELFRAQMQAAFNQLTVTLAGFSSQLEAIDGKLNAWRDNAPGRTEA